MVISHNLPAINVLNAQRKEQTQSTKTLEKLSSGYRISRAADDAAGLGVSQRMRGQIHEMGKCEMNVSQGMDIAKTADGALEEVSEMLRRVKELCVAAANGTYGTEEHEAVSAEINQVFSESERIFEGTKFNNIQLFRYAGSLLGDPVVNKIYTETVTELAPTILEEWGDLDLIGGSEREFDLAAVAKNPTATLMFDSDIDVNDARTLIGKSISIQGNYTADYVFYKAGEPAPSYGIPVGPADTVQAVLDKLAASAPTVSKIKLNGRNVTFEYNLTNLTQNNPIGSGTITIPNADGTYYNGYAITSRDDNFLKQVDGSDSTNNPTVYNARMEDSFSIYAGAGGLTAGAIADLKKNTLHIVNKRIQFTDTNEPGKIQISVGMTTKQLRDAIVAAGGSGNTSIAAGAADGEIKVTVINASTTTNGAALVYEETKSSTDPAKTGTTFNTVSPGAFQVDKIKDGTMEGVSEHLVTLPPNLQSKDSFSVSIQGATYIFYNSDKFPHTGYDSLQSGANMVDIKGLSETQIQQSIASHLNSRYTGTAALNANGTITVRGSTLGTTLNPSIGGASSSFYEYTPAETTYTSKQIFSSNKYLNQERRTSFQIPSTGGALDFSKLENTGFSLHMPSSATFEFNADGTAMRPTAKQIDLSSVTNTTDFLAVLQDKLDATYGTGSNKVTASITADGRVTMSSTVSSAATSSMVDGFKGYDGLFTNSGDAQKTVRTSGGTKAGSPQTLLDFSSVTPDNRDDLLGKGFRVTCATCSGEYINVIFVHDTANTTIPPTFEIDDPDNPGTKRTIHNYAVALKDVTDGASIVSDIVRQLTPNLNHFTGVEVGDPNTKLVLKDKRIGNLQKTPGTTDYYRAKVQSGVYTNFIYEATVEEVRQSALETPPTTPGGTPLIYRNLLIYAGSEPEHQWIPIHLPYLSIDGLGLSETEQVEDADGAMDLMERVHEAQAVVSAARGRLGADDNRLEHAFNAITSANLQLTDAESRIRDADMAKEMVAFVRSDILGQAQQSMLAHTNQNLQQMNKLLG